MTVKISQLPAGTALAGTEPIPTVQTVSGTLTTVATTPADVVVYVQGQPLSTAQVQQVIGNFIPTTDNTDSVGSSTERIAASYVMQSYVGTNNTPVLNGGIVGYWPQTAAEQAAGVTPTNYQYVPLDLRRYGADPTGVATSDTALANAISVCGSQGGTIIACEGKFVFANTYNLDNKTTIIIQGAGGVSAGAQPATLFQYTGSAAPWFNWNSAKGLEIRDVMLQHTNSSFVGPYIQCNNDGTNGDPAFCALRCVTISPSVTGASFLDLNKCIEFTLEGCALLGGNPAITATAAGTYANSIRFRDCQFRNGDVVPVQASNAQAWVFEGCVFEPLASGAAGALAGASGAAFGGESLAINGCWFGDAGAVTSTWLYLGGVSGISNCHFDGTQANTTAIQLDAVQGCVMTANSFDTLLNAIDFGVTPCRGIVSTANTASSVTNPYANSSNVTLGEFTFSIGYGFGIPSGHGYVGSAGIYRVYTDGHIEMDFLATGLSNGTNTITIPSGWPAMPTGIAHALLTMQSVVNASATIRVTGYPAGGTTITVELNDSGATADSVQVHLSGY